MIKTYRTIGFMLAGVFISTSLMAGEVAGTVKTRAGQVEVIRDGKKFAAEVGMPVQVADRLRTGGDGSVGVTLSDNTLLSAGPDSTLVVQRYAYDSTTEAGRMSIGIRRGTVSVATGRIARHSPDSVDFHTPTSVLGVRGTEFVVEVGGNDE